MRIIELQNKIQELSDKLNKLEGDKILDNNYSVANYHQLENSLLQVEEDILRLQSHYQHSTSEMTELIAEIKEEEENKNILRHLAPLYFIYKLNQN